MRGNELPIVTAPSNSFNAFVATVLNATTRGRGDILILIYATTPSTNSKLQIGKFKNLSTKLGLIVTWLFK